MADEQEICVTLHLVFKSTACPVCDGKIDVSPENIVLSVECDECGEILFLESSDLTFSDSLQ